MLLLLLLLLLMLFRKIAPSAIIIVLRTRRSTFLNANMHRKDQRSSLQQIWSSAFRRLTCANAAQFDQFTPDVSDGNVAFLDAGRICSRHCDGNVGSFCEETAILAGKSDGFEVLVRGLFHCREHVGGIAACANAYGDVAWPGQRLNLSSEYPLKAVVICHRGKDGRISCQRDRRQAGSFNNKAPNEFRGEMLRISRAAAIAEEQKFASCSQAIANQKGGLNNLATAVTGDF